MTEACPVCKKRLNCPAIQNGEKVLIDCPRCGPYQLSASALEDISGRLLSDKRAWVKLSHVLNKMTERERGVFVDTYAIDNILSVASLPSLSEQLDNLISWLALKQPSTGKSIGISDMLEAAVGAEDADSLMFVIEQAKNSGLTVGDSRRATSRGDSGMAQLTLKGWEYFNELQRGTKSSRTAFMAMKFGDPVTDALFSDHFKAAVESTGFVLRRLDEVPRAGLIDDRLRVDIRQSRFLIADLTHHNNGAYWEAGFAEGLGKPVIYTCSKSVFEDKNNGGTHFDTNHHLTVIWDLDNIGAALEMLKATIRATLPDEAKLSDEG